MFLIRLSKHFYWAKPKPKGSDRALNHDGKEWGTPIRGLWPSATGVLDPDAAFRFYSKDAAEEKAFALTVESPELIGKISVVEWSGDQKKRP